MNGIVTHILGNVNINQISDGRAAVDWYHITADLSGAYQIALQLADTHQNVV